MPWDLEAEVVVIGAGAAGSVAAGVCATHHRGVDTVLLEQDTSKFSNSSIASAFIPAAGTRFQQAAGYPDSPETMAADIQRKNNNESDEALTLNLCCRSAEVIHWLADVAQVPMEFAEEISWFGHSVHRMHSHPLRSGIPILADLHNFLRACPRLTFMDKTVAVGLLRDDGGVISGVEATSNDALIRIRTRQVVLSTGGFGANPKMVAQYIPEMSGAWHIGASTSRGDGIRWGIEFDGASALMNAYQGRDTIREDSTRVTPGVITEGGIAVNQAGERFAREDIGYSPLAAVFRKQPGEFVYLIWDERIHREIENLHIMVEADKAGEIRRFATSGELAEFFSIPRRPLERTVSSYNQVPIDGIDEVGRLKCTYPLESPYFVARVTGAIGHTQGGLIINSNGQVLDSERRIIPGLYAAGNDAAGLSGSGSDGYLSGNGWFFAITTGYVIGEAIAAEA